MRSALGNFYHSPLKLWVGLSPTGKKMDCRVDFVAHDRPQINQFAVKIFRVYYFPGKTGVDLVLGEIAAVEY